MGKSNIEAMLASQLTMCDDIPEFTIEFRALSKPNPAFRWDFAWPDYKLLVECQGAVWVPKTGHTSGYGVTRDCKKQSYAAANGWYTMAFTSQQIKEGLALILIQEFFKNAQKTAK